MEKIKCTIERITFQNPENGYSVLQASIKGYREGQTIVGTFHEVTVGAVLTVEGNWRVDKLVADKGYISKNLFQRLFVDGIQLITKLKSNMKGALMSVSDKVLLRKRAIIESVNDELKNIAQIEHSRHRSVCNFAANLLGAVAAYCYLPKKPSIQVVRVIDNQLTLF